MISIFSNGRESLGGSPEPQSVDEYLAKMVEILSDPAPPPTTQPETELAKEIQYPDIQTLPSYATPSATKALQKQLRKLIKLQESTILGHGRLWILDTDKLDHLYTLNFTLSSFDPDLLLAGDMRRLGIKGVEVEVKFGPQHPNTPPFVRIVKPRFLQFMYGGGGHVTAGGISFWRKLMKGSICIEMLTMEGWKKDISLDAVLTHVHAALSDPDPVPARIIADVGYSVYEAVNAYVRVARSHGWGVPRGWETLFSKDS
jgi:ubiquitin-conjugating enzyme E2 Q